MPYHQRIREIVDHYKLIPHPEGGFFRETYRATQGVALASGAAKSAATAIYFLLTEGNFSAFHRITSDELWHFYEGDPLLIHVIHPQGHYQQLKLGPDTVAGQYYQVVVPAGSWFGSEVAPGGRYGLVGCTVAPGFEFADFELAKRSLLLEQYPQHAAIIERLTRG